MTLLPRHPSIVHALLANATRGADAPRTVFVPERSEAALGEATELRHDTVAVAACRAAYALSEAGVAAGDRVLLCLPTAPEFVTAFFGSLLLGAIPTAVATPGGFGSMDLFRDKFDRITRYLEPTAIVASSLVSAAVRPRTTMIDGAHLHDLATTPTGPMLEPRLPADDDVAFIQATSGSTGTPKGVRITHSALAANCEQISRAAALELDDTWVGWLPLHHDMGLIGGFLTPLFRGGDAVVMPPSRFLRNPAEWLRAVTRYRGSVTAAPNFAYGYAAARISDAELGGVDLSSWRFLFCGAEPIHPPTVQAFVDRFAAWGLPRDAVVPCYGMAEAALAVTVSWPRSPIDFDTVSRRTLAESGVAVDVPADDPDATQIVDCGAPVEGTEVRIVDETGAVREEGMVGRVQFRGPSTTIGYFGMPEATAAARHEGWWDTGDLGYLRDGCLRVTGRHKDLIIIRGANYAPTDFEVAAQSVDGVRPGGVAAVGRIGADGLSEELHLIVESALPATEHDALRRAVRVAVSKRTGILPAGVHLVAPRAIPKTTSGKIQRSEAGRLLLPEGSDADRNPGQGNLVGTGGATL
ncbi:MULTISPECIES: fatty acyl-AMP ligase [unclassified Nocardia]|uniref:fatty acyl-AMP ligase n=1 Tax=unclassified Nocardia TaxID=2637762 RepID=UPI001CE4458A|nr:MULTISPECIES: fatty acyl-AMP ligase [unclassified Nocardia]